MSRASNKVDEALDQVDRILEKARAQSDAPKKKPDSEWDVDTERFDVPPRASMTSQPGINVNVTLSGSGGSKPGSDPPVTPSAVALTWKKGIVLGKLPSWAVVLIVVGLGALAIVAVSIVYVLTHT